MQILDTKTRKSHQLEIKLLRIENIELTEILNLIDKYDHD